MSYKYECNNNDKISLNYNLMVCLYKVQTVYNMKNIIISYYCIALMVIILILFLFPIERRIIN